MIKSRKKNKHGGKRVGSGRKAGSTKDDNRKKMSITLPMFLVLKLREHKYSQSEVVERALIEWFLIHNK